MGSFQPPFRCAQGDGVKLPLPPAEACFRAPQDLAYQPCRDTKRMKKTSKHSSRTFLPAIPKPDLPCPGAPSGVEPFEVEPEEAAVTMAHTLEHMLLFLQSNSCPLAGKDYKDPRVAIQGSGQVSGRREPLFLIKQLHIPQRLPYRGLRGQGWGWGLYVRSRYVQDFYWLWTA